MLKIQKITRRGKGNNSGAKIRATFKECDIYIGFKSGIDIIVYFKDDTLFYSYGSHLLEEAGFKELTTRKSFVLTGDQIYVSVPYKWLNENCNSLSHVKVYYTKIGLFVKPYRGDSNE